MPSDALAPTVTLVGHPFTPIGMGEHVRCTFRALRSVARTPRLRDIYRLTEADEPLRHEMQSYESRTLSAINVFHINADEVEQALAHIGASEHAGYNVIYPLWELSVYPAASAARLERFDEVWAPSRFIEEGLRAATTKPVRYMPLAAQVVMTSFLGRRYFGIPESPYTFLFFFDLRSYISRKNPQGVVDAFRALLKRRPSADVALVIKVNGAELAPDALHELEASVADLDDRVVLVARTMSDNEIKNLVRACDCFVSLHRSEGFGFGAAQAMSLDRPVIATAYSGNTDFMAEGACFPVDYTLVPVPDGAYPHWQDQVWADPSIESAAAHMARLVDDPRIGYETGRRAGNHIRAHFSFRATGTRVARRLDEIAATLAVETP